MKQYNLVQGTSAVREALHTGSSSLTKTHRGSSWPHKREERAVSLSAESSSLFLDCSRVVLWKISESVLIPEVCHRFERQILGPCLLSAMIEKPGVSRFF